MNIYLYAINIKINYVTTHIDALKKHGGQELIQNAEIFGKSVENLTYQNK